MSGHPTWVELEGFLDGTLAPERARSVVAHLLHGCASCQAEIRRRHELELNEEAAEGFSRDLTPEEDAAYDEVLDRAFTQVARWGEDACQVTARTREALALVEEKGTLALVEGAQRIQGPPMVDALLEKSWSLRHESPEQMVEYALCAVLAATNLDTRRIGAERVADCRSRAYGVLGNALRVVGRLEEAQRALDRGYELHLEGSRDPLEGARLLDFQASLYSARRQFADACKVLESIYQVYRRQGQDHLAGRALISKGIYTGYDGDTQQALDLLTEGLSLLDRSRDTELVAMALHNRAYLLAELGRYREARKLLFEIRPVQEIAGKRINLLKIRALEGRINLGLGQLERAERDFLEARQGFQKAGLPFQAALAGFELALTRSGLGRRLEARQDVLEAAEVFLDLNIGREGLMAVAVVRHAFEQEQEAHALLERTVAILRRTENDPRINARIWAV